MSVAVVAFPVLHSLGAQWLEAFRARHDPQAARLAGHFTLVFPADEASAVAVEEATLVAARQAAFPFTLGEARVVADRLSGGHHVFLIPEGGSTELLALHKALHAGRLATHLRRDIPFVPHITVAAATSGETCQALAEQARSGLPLQGSIDALDVLEVADEVRSLAKVRLRPRR